MDLVQFVGLELRANVPSVLGGLKDLVVLAFMANAFVLEHAVGTGLIG